MILDPNNNPVANASVEHLGETITTDENGLFVFKDVDMNADGAFIKVEEPGYFMGSRRFYPTLNTTSYVEIKLLEKNNLQTVPSNANSTVNLPDGGSIQFAANSFVDANDGSYNGQVQVAAQWLNPIADDLHQIMPSNLEGLDSDKQKVALSTFGMLAVELTSPDGETLNLGNGENATLSFPVPSALLGNAPTKIPLWYLDETTGIWQEKGTAQLIGNNYVGEVNHFSFWNCDDPFPLVQITGCFSTPSGHPLSNMEVQITHPLYGTSGFVFTDNLGCFTGLVPEGEVMEIHLNGKGPCQDIHHQDQIGPFSSPTDLGNITLNAGDIEGIVFVEGSLADCNGMPYQFGAIQVFSDGVPHSFLVNNGAFSIPVNICNGTTDFNYIAHGTDGLITYSSTFMAIPVEQPVTEVGLLVLCNDPTYLPEEYIRVTLDGDSYLWDLNLLPPNPLAISGGVAQMFDDSIRIGFNMQYLFPFDSTTFQTSMGPFVEGTNQMSLIGGTQFAFGNLTGQFDISDEVVIFCDFGSTSSIHCGSGMSTIEITSIGDVGEPVTGFISGDAFFYDRGAITGANVIIPYIINPNILGPYPFEMEFRVIRNL